MSKILIVYASHFGQTRGIGAAIAQRLRERDHEVDFLDATTAGGLPYPDDYDAVVLGSRVELGRHAPAILQYIRRHRDALRRVPTAFFSVSMAAAHATPGSDPNGYLAATFESLGWHPVQAVAFAGGLPYRRYGRILRFVMSRIARAAGNTTDTSRNHEFTDWRAVTAFADKIGYIGGGAGISRDKLSAEVTTKAFPST